MDSKKICWHESPIIGLWVKFREYYIWDELIIYGLSWWMTLITHTNDYSAILRWLLIWSKDFWIPALQQIVTLPDLSVVTEVMSPMTWGNEKMISSGELDMETGLLFSICSLSFSPDQIIACRFGWCHTWLSSGRISSLTRVIVPSGQPSWYFPFVLYNGEQPWSVPCDIKETILMPDPVSLFIPSFKSTEWYIPLGVLWSPNQPTSHPYTSTCSLILFHGRYQSQITSVSSVIRHWNLTPQKNPELIISADTIIKQV